MIALFDDFGVDGPYVGQVKAVIEHECPGTQVIDLQHDAPACNPRAAAYLLAALAPRLAPGAVILAVVDPGVGSHRHAVVVDADERRFVGPDNGLFDVVMAHSAQVEVHEICWRPTGLSPTFHGRDVFAPIAARLAAGIGREGDLLESRVPDPGRGWPGDLHEIIYIDHFGNTVTGLRAAGVSRSQRVLVGGTSLEFSATYTDVENGEAFWYANSIGLVELACNGGNFARRTGMDIGTEFRIA